MSLPAKGEKLTSVSERAMAHLRCHLRVTSSLSVGMVLFSDPRGVNNNSSP